MENNISAIPTTIPRKYASKRAQRGEAELMMFGLVVVATILFSGTVWLLTWVKNNKYSEREARKLAAILEKKKSEFSGRRDPAEYLVFCDKAAWALTQTKYDCRVLPESYGELFLIPR
jgi:cell division protein FtsI/penicillin-binding protein 2